MTKTSSEICGRKMVIRKFGPRTIFGPSPTRCQVSAPMPKSTCNLSGIAKRSAREEHARHIAKMPKMSAFLKPADSAPPSMKFINLAMMSIENEHAKQLDISNLVDNFAQEKIRK